MHIDDFFQKQSFDDHNSLNCRVITAHLDGSLEPVGFFAMCVDSEPEWEFTTSQRLFPKVAFRARNNSILTLQLLWVGVAVQLQRRGIGTLLMARAIDDFYEVTDRTGIAAMTLKPIDLNAARFYQKIGFTSYGTFTPQRMFLAAQAVIDLKLQNS